MLIRYGQRFVVLSRRATGKGQNGFYTRKWLPPQSFCCARLWKRGSLRLQRLRILQLGAPDVVPELAGDAEPAIAVSK